MWLLRKCVLDHLCHLGQLELLTLQCEAELRARWRGTVGARTGPLVAPVRSAAATNSSPAFGNRGRRCVHDCSQPACAGDCAGRAFSRRGVRRARLKLLQPVLCRACGQYYASNCSVCTHSAAGPYEYFARCVPKGSAPSASASSERTRDTKETHSAQVLTSGSANSAVRAFVCRANTPASGSSASAPPPVASSAIANASAQRGARENLALATIETHVLGAGARAGGGDALPRAPQFLVDPSVLSKLARTPSSTRLVVPLVAAASRAQRLHDSHFVNALSTLGTCVSRKPLTARSATRSPAPVKPNASHHLAGVYMLDEDPICADRSPTPSRESLAVGKSFFSNRRESLSVRRARPFAPQRSASSRPQQLHAANDPELAALQRLAERLDVQSAAPLPTRERLRARAHSAASRPLGAPLVERHLRRVEFARSEARPVSAHFSLC